MKAKPKRGHVIDTMFMNEEDVERLCTKSLAISGKKWLWKKIGNKHNLSWEEVEEQLDIKINRDKLYMERIRLHDESKRSPEQRNELGPTTERDNTQGSSELLREVEIGEPIVTIDGKEVSRGGSASDRAQVRSGETENGFTTTESAE